MCYYNYKSASQLSQRISMKKRYLNFLLFSVVCLAFGLFFAYSVEAGTVNTGIEFASGTGLSNQDIRVTIAKIIRIILGFLGIIAIGLTMYAGFLWMTSGGNEEKIAQAKLILRNGLIGLVIILSSFAIVTFILGKLMDATGGSGSGGNGGGNNNGGGIGALGNGIVKSVYPEPFQRDVPRNTSIVVTFREPILASSVCDSVTNESPAKCAAGAKAKNSFRLYQTSVGDVLGTNVQNIKVTSSDNITFIFKPSDPIGSLIQPVNYTAKLTRDIKKADGSDAFKLSDFYWSFEVVNSFDIKPPQIKNIKDGGIFPLPDNAADEISGVQQAVTATGSITVNGAPDSYQAASASIKRLTPPINPVEASLSGVNICSDGYVIATITAGNKVSLNYSQEGLVDEEPDILNNQVSFCGLILTLATTTAGTQWRIDVVSEKQPETLTVGDRSYSFVRSAPQPGEIMVGLNNDATARNIADAINEIHPQVTATVNGKKINLEAKIAGASGNNITLSSSKIGSSLVFEAMRGGKDKTTTYSIKDKPDQPKNTVIQINFNEAINPLMISGTSEELADKLRVVNASLTAKGGNQSCINDAECLSYKCVNSVCQGNQLAGSFVVSNQYRTVEFISDSKCGINGCGENIYCLPANSNLKVEMQAASLQSCTDNTDCTFPPYTTCKQGLCKDGAEKNYPAASTLNGVVDLADNSLDGNRNDNAQGPVLFYNDNKTPQDNSGNGDNYLMSFWISDRLDLTPPAITNISVGNGASRVNLVKAIEIVFSKLMMSSSLATGTITINNGVKDIVHRLINLWSLANNQIGYWIGKQDFDTSNPLDNLPDATRAFLNHGTFSQSTLYDAQVGSGVKDIYQNCYKPSSGPSCAANSLQPSCCRDSNGNLVPTTNLTPDGNCPDVVSGN